MKDPRWHFRKKYHLTPEQTDRIIRYYILESPKISSRSRYSNTTTLFSNLYKTKIPYDAIRYLVYRYSAYSKWRMAGKPEKRKWRTRENY